MHAFPSYNYNCMYLRFMFQRYMRKKYYMRRKGKMKKGKRRVKIVMREAARDDNSCVDPLVAAMAMHHLMDLQEKNGDAICGPSSSLSYARASPSTPFDVKVVPGKRMTFEIDVPGLAKSDIKVEVEEKGCVLVVSGERKRSEDGKEEGVVYVRRERRVGKFVRNFRLPDDADLNAVSAKCEDGVLSVTVQMKPPPERRKLRTVEVVSMDGGDGSREWEVNKG